MSEQKRGVFRVNYQQDGQPKTGLVAAFTDGDAAAHFGVADQSGVQVTKALYPVEVAGVDATHDALPSLPVMVAPFDYTKVVSREEFNRLEKQLAELHSKVSGQGVGVE